MYLSDNALQIAKLFSEFMYHKMTCGMSNVLEVGCGSGLAARYVSQWVDKLVLTDLDNDALTYNRALFANQSNVQILTLDDIVVQNKFDAVYYFLSLHHIELIEMELKRTRLYLKDLGRLFICEIEPRRNIFFHQFDPVPHDGIAITELRKALENAGYHSVEISPIGQIYRDTSRTNPFEVYGLSATK